MFDRLQNGKLGDIIPSILTVIILYIKVIAVKGRCYILILQAQYMSDRSSGWSFLSQLIL
jgi:hypothetical protein